MNEEAPNSLVSAVTRIACVLHEAASPRISSWQPQFIDTCTAWCMIVEGELLALSDEAIERVRMAAKQQLQATHPDVPLPSAENLIDAQHVLYQTLISNNHISDALYTHLSQTYEFLTSYDDGPENFLKDVVHMAQSATTCAVLEEVNELLADDTHEK
ncbi:hypothetical protein BC940DRAFT_334207 [Gongronella butleri]|nr:hypothetical protein BC940DRAFT_334207 [Gongronella butleri]